MCAFVGVLLKLQNTRRNVKDRLVFVLETERFPLCTECSMKLRSSNGERRNIFEIFVLIIDKFRSLLVNDGFSSWTLCVRLV